MQIVKKKVLKSINQHNLLIKKQTNDIIQKIDIFSKYFINAINKNNKILIAGNGGSAADAQHFSTELTVKMKKFRRALPLISLCTDTSALTAIGNDFSFRKIFSRQIEAIGNEGDIFVSISTSGNSANIIEALKVSRKKKLINLGLLGNKGGLSKKLIDDAFIVKSSDPSRIQEIHILFYQNLCQVIEEHFSKI